MIRYLISITFFPFIVLTRVEAEYEYEFPSSSSDWKLSMTRRKHLRQFGYCVKSCGFGYDTEADGYDNYVRHFVKTKATGEFRELTEFIDNDELEGDLTNMLQEIDFQIDGKRTQDTLAMLIDVYCVKMNVTFDECHKLTENAIQMENGEKCLDVCTEQIEEIDFTPKFSEMPPWCQEAEECLDSYRGPEEFFDYNDKEFIKVPEMVKSFKKYGYLVIENFFPTELMSEINEVMNTWDEKGKWKNFSYSDLYSTYPGQLSNYEKRKEFVLPYVHPFKTLLLSVHDSILMEILRAYGNNFIDLDFPASIMSYPGAIEQETHGDHGFVASMIKIGAAVQDIHEINGPTSFCPCTHKYGIFNGVYNLECGIRHHPNYTSAGTVVIYDMAVKHRGSANKGDIRRYLIDLSYSAGHYTNFYYETYPKLAQEYVLWYREEFKYL